MPNQPTVTLIADQERLGSETLVNTAISGDQSGAKVTALANGQYVVIWQDSSQGDGGAVGDDSGSAIKMQLFNADGTKSGVEILVNSWTAGDQIDAGVTALPGGGFVATWIDVDSGYVVANVYGASAAEVSGDIFVNTTPGSGAGAVADVAVLADGRFVIAWKPRT